MSDMASNVGGGSTDASTWPAGDGAPKGGGSTDGESSVTAMTTAWYGSAYETGHGTSGFGGVYSGLGAFTGFGWGDGLDAPGEGGGVACGPSSGR